MDDLISRQAAIDALEVLCQEHRYRIPGKRETYSQYNEAWQDALDRAEVAIGNLPSAQPEPHWIPCSERLPKEKQSVLVTDGAVIWVCDIISTDEGYKWKDSDGYWLNLDEWIAWMKLPEPYKGGERSEQ